MRELINKLDATTIPVMPKEYRKYQTMNLDDAYEQGWNDLQRCIEKLPSAQPEPHWIPVSEMIPVELEDVLVCTKNGHVACGYYESDYNNEWCIDKEFYLRWGDVVAWMPLPEPYNGGEQE